MTPVTRLIQFALLAVALRKVSIMSVCLEVLLTKEKACKLELASLIVYLEEGNYPRLHLFLANNMVGGQDP